MKVLHYNYLLVSTALCIYTARRESNYNGNHNNNNNHIYDSSRLSHNRFHNRTQFLAQKDDNNDDNKDDKSNSPTTVSVKVETANKQIFPVSVKQTIVL